MVGAVKQLSLTQPQHEHAMEAALCITEDPPCSTENNSGWKGPQSSLLLNLGTAVKLDQLAQGFTQLGLESFWAWRLHSLSVQPHPLPCGKEVGFYLSREATSSEAVAEGHRWDHGFACLRTKGHGNLYLHTDEWTQCLNCLCALGQDWLCHDHIHWHCLAWAS